MEILKVKTLRQKLEAMLECLEDYGDNDIVETEPNTYGIGDVFLAVGECGFVPEDFEVRKRGAK